MVETLNITAKFGPVHGDRAPSAWGAAVEAGRPDLLVIAQTPTVEIDTDLSSLTAPQLLALGRRSISK